MLAQWHSLTTLDVFKSYNTSLNVKVDFKARVFLKNFAFYDFMKKGE
ncbi:hypothetical protein EMIT0180MI3_10609 [Priestia megaterium]